MDIKDLANKLARYYDTRDPYAIADSLGYILIETPLDGIRGFYQYLHRCHMIYIDNNLSEKERKWVCAHEIGHSLLHKDMNRIFMDMHTYIVTSKYEREADRFAVDLLYSDEDLQEFLEFPIAVVSDCLGISHDLAMYRMSSIIK